MGRSAAPMKNRRRSIAFGPPFALDRVSIKRLSAKRLSAKRLPAKRLGERLTGG